MHALVPSLSVWNILAIIPLQPLRLTRSGLRLKKHSCPLRKLLLTGSLKGFDTTMFQSLAENWYIFGVSLQPCCRRMSPNIFSSGSWFSRGVNNNWKLNDCWRSCNINKVALIVICYPNIGLARSWLLSLRRWRHELHCSLFKNVSNIHTYSKPCLTQAHHLLLQCFQRADFVKSALVELGAPSVALLRLASGNALSWVKRTPLSSSPFFFFFIVVKTCPWQEAWKALIQCAWV